MPIGPREAPGRSHRHRFRENTMRTLDFFRFSAACAALLPGLAAANPLVVSISHSGALPGNPQITAQVQCTSNTVPLTAYYQRKNSAGQWSPTQFIAQFQCKPPVNSGAVVVVTKSRQLGATVHPGEQLRFRVQQGGQMSPWVVHTF